MEENVEKTLTIKTWPIAQIPYDNDEIYKPYPRAKLPKDMVILPKQFMKDNPGTSINDLNSFGYRSDEFKKEHEGLHILFSGCSYTWGSGLLVEESWPKILYNKISSEVECSGYFNLGFPGSGIKIQTVDMIKYCETYGKPDIIFFNVTDLWRFFGLRLDQKTGDPLDPPVIGNAFIKFEKKLQPLFRFLGYQYYYMFEKYCKEAGIKLYAFSWKHNHFFNDLSKMENSSIDRFYSYAEEEMINFVTQYEIENPDKKYLRVARDRQHYGVAFNEFWSDFMYRKYKEENV